MNILQIGQTAQGAGVENAVRLVCRGLARAGHNVRLVTDSTIYAEDLEQVGVKSTIVDLSDRSLRGFWTAAREVRKLFKEFAPDIVHVHGRSHTLISLLAGRRPDCFTLHNSHLTHRISLFDQDWIRPFFPHPKRTIVICEEAKDFVQQAMGVDAKSVDLVYNGVDCDEFRPPTEEERAEARQSFGVDNHQILAVYVGRFHEQKQPETLVDLAVALKENGRSDVRIVMVGGGHLQESLERAIADHGVGDICKIFPWMPQPVTAYWAADLCLLPSKHEGFPLGVVEAMASGSPILRTRAGGWQAMIREGVTGFSSDLAPQSFVDVALDALGDKERLHQMRSCARQHAVEELSLERSITDTLGVYDKVLHKAAR